MRADRCAIEVVDGVRWMIPLFTYFQSCGGQRVLALLGVFSLASFSTKRRFLSIAIFQSKKCSILRTI